MRGVQLGHHGGDCTFETMLAHFADTEVIEELGGTPIGDETLAVILARIVGDLYLRWHGRSRLTDTGTLAAFAAGGALLGGFLHIERHSGAPMLPPQVVRDRNCGGANTVMFLLGTGMLAMFYLLTLYMQVVRGYSALHTGLAYLPYVAGVGLASGGLGPRMLGALPARAVIAAGMILGAAGLGWYAAMLTRPRTITRSCSRPCWPAGSAPA